MKKRLELDIVRAFAILAVLLIHATSEATVELPIHSKAQAFYLMLNKLGNFAVPAFLWLSGVVLFYRYFPTWSARDVITFYRKRLQYIVIPYLIWSFFYYIYNPWIEPSVQPVIDWADFFAQILWADTGYHLYFIIIIVQFYILFPLLISLAKWSKRFAAALPLFGIAVQVGAFCVNRWVEPIPHRASLAVTYIGVFCIGAFIGMYYDRAVAWAERYRLLVWLITPALGLWLFLIYELDERGVPYGGQAVAELTMSLYAIAAGICFLLIGRRLLERPFSISSGLLSFGAASFGIYFSHPAFLTAWRTFVHENAGTPGYHWVTFGGFLIVLVLPWAAVFLVKRIPGSWLALGR